MAIQNIKKTSDIDTDKFSHYMEVYGQYINHLVDKEINILEVGVRNGESLRLWKAFFKKANIVGIDINPECKKHEEDRIKVIIGDQNKKDTFNEISHMKFDIIIDDGSHVGHHIINTFDYTFDEMLANGGLYFIEDTAMVFHPHFLGEKQDLGKFESFLNRLRRSLDLDVFSYKQIQNREAAGMINHKSNDPNHAIARQVHSLTGVNREEFNNNIHYIHYYSNIIVVKKKLIEEQHFGKILMEENIEH